MSEDMEMGAPPPEESGNRMFLIGAIILGGVFVLALIGIFALYFLTQGGQPAAPQPQNLTSTAAALQGATQTLNAQGTQTRVAIAIQTAVITYTPTLSQTKALTSTFTTTPVVFATLSLASDTPTNTQTPVGAAAATRTRTPVGATAVRTGAATALPTTGFGDSAGLPALILLGAGSLFVIILARQLRLNRVRR
jgi:flagellar basal body-associated protein FliL